MRAVETHYEPAMVSMSKLSWGTVEYVGDQSEYVSMIHATLKTCVGAIQELITNKRYFRTFCDKLIESFVSRFAANLTRCKPISEIGAEQMLLDTQAVKSFLVEIPNLGLETAVAVPTSYVSLFSFHFLLHRWCHLHFQFLNATNLAHYYFLHMPSTGL